MSHFPDRYVQAVCDLILDGDLDDFTAIPDDLLDKLTDQQYRAYSWAMNRRGLHCAIDAAAAWRDGPRDVPPPAGLPMFEFAPRVPDHPE